MAMTTVERRKRLLVKAVRNQCAEKLRTDGLGTDIAREVFKDTLSVRVYVETGNVLEPIGSLEGFLAMEELEKPSERGGFINGELRLHPLLPIFDRSSSLPPPVVRVEQIKGICVS